uniref:Uncharacterized protein n=1 Tax=viral metagenome TaxID=1070528 RepID=A0A6C0JGW7_9ZZZZ
MPLSKKKYLKKKSLRKNKHRRTHKNRKTLIKRRKYSKHSKNNIARGNNDKLSETEIEEILDSFSSSMTETKRNEAIRLLRLLRFDPTYTVDCFLSKIPWHPDDSLTLYEQAERKVQCWFRGEGKIA